jgi:putative ABC transport system permease protein
MLQNYLLTALRNLLRHKAFSFIHVSGLSMGLACCMLIVLYTKDEVSFDRFHEKKDRIFRVTVTTTNDQETHKMGSTNMVVGPSFKADIPEIETFIRMQNGPSIVRQGTETFTQEVLSVDGDFFSVFSLPLVTGDPKTVFKEPNSLVLTEETALKFFGSAEPVGKTLELEFGGQFEPFVVSGVAKNPPLNSSLQFGMLMPFQYTEKRFPDKEWLGFYMNTFVLLSDQADYRTVEPKLDRVFQRRARQELKEVIEKHDFKDKIHFGLQPLPEIHLDTQYGDIRNGLASGSKPIYSYILTGIAVFILLIACINFINLTVAHSLRRGKEIGIRKVVGGRRKQLIRQFLGESYVLCFIAFVMAGFIVELTLPIFNELANKRLSFAYLLDTRLIVGYLGLFLLTGFIAGFYPALVLSGFHPVQVLYNRHRLTGKSYLTRSLVVLQFALATFLIITTMVMYSQFDYLTHKDLGYNDENLVVIRTGRGRPKPELVDLFKTELTKVPSVQQVATKDRGLNFTGGQVNGKQIGFSINWMDDQFLPTLQIPVLKGRNFSKDFPADAEQSILVNETFVKEAGLKNPIGETVFNVNGNNKAMTIIGVVKDYHYASLKEKIGPQLFLVGTGDLWVKIKPDNITQTMRDLERIHRQLVPFRPYEYDFMDTLNERHYREEATWKQVITVGAILSIFISCMGLFGLATLSILQRTKEIGIRKVFGAAVGDIVLLLSADFMKLVSLAFVLAIPMGYYATHRWLENFPYRIALHWWIWAAPCLATLLIALLTVMTRTFQAASANPVKSLRTE